MSAPLQVIARGDFVSDGVGEIINLPSSTERFEILDVTNISKNPLVAADFIRGYWQLGMPAGFGISEDVSAAPPILDTSGLAVGGLTLTNTSLQAPGAPVASTSITAANPAVVATGTTAPLVAGDVVRLINQTGMQQVSGMEFTIDTIVAGVSFNLSFLNTVAFAAPAAAGIYRRIVNPPQYSPRQFTITNISLAAQALVTLSVTHDIQIGEELAFVLPDAFGMVEMNGLRGRVVAIGAADASGYVNTITLDIDSSAFTAFAFPTTALFQATAPQVVRFGSLAAGVVAATDNVSALQIELGAGFVGAAADEMQWIAMSGISL